MVRSELKTVTRKNQSSSGRLMDLMSAKEKVRYQRNKKQVTKIN